MQYSPAHGAEPWPGRTLVVIALVAAVAFGCDQAPGSLEQPASPEPGPSGMYQDADAIRRAIELRELLGIRADLDHVKALEADPAALARGRAIGLDIGVTEAEATRLRVDETRGLMVMTVVERYGATVPDEWAGLSIDPSEGGLVTARFTARVDHHEASIRKLVRPDARLDVIRVRWPLASLQRLADRISDERDWFASVGASYNGGGVDIIKNLVTIDVLSRDPNIGSLIVARFDAAGQMLVRVDEDMPWTDGVGRLTVIAETASGDPVPGLICVLIPDDPRALPEGGSGAPTDDDGRCYESGGATHYTVQLVASQGGSQEVVGAADTVIYPDRETTVRIEVNTP